MKQGLFRRRRAHTACVDGGRVLQVAGPESVEVRARMMAVGSQLASTLVVTGYPAEVTPGWLSPLLNFPGHVDIALHIDPVPNPVAAASLKKQRARLESGRRAGFDKGRLEDPEVEAAAQDAADLAFRIARAESKLFRLALYLTVHAADEATLADQVAAVRAEAESLLMSLAPTTYRALPGWLATLPLGIDTLKVRRTFDTTALAACFPFASPELPLPRETAPQRAGVLYGVNALSGSPVLWDRFGQDNYNSITLARSGAGKSYLMKLELLRLAFTGVSASVIDPEDEYVRLAESVGGTIVALGSPGVRLNPFDLPPNEPHADGSEGDALTRRVLFVHTFLAVLFNAEPSAEEKAVLDQAILATYARSGITTDPHTWKQSPPCLADLAAVLREDGRSTAGELAARLAPFVSGSHAGYFNGPSTAETGGHLVVFALRQLPEEVKAPAMLLALDAVWRRVTQRAQRHLAVVDEAWLLMQEGAGARFLFRMGKSARKHWAGLAVVTQDAGDVLSSPLGQAIVSNAATQILFRQAPQAIDHIAEAFHLSHGERDFLLSASRGEALLLTGDRRHKVALTSVAAPEEHHLITTDPSELAAQREDTEVDEDASTIEDVAG